MLFASWLLPQLDARRRPKRAVSRSRAEKRSEVLAHENPQRRRWDGFGGGEPVTSLLPSLTGSCPSSSMRTLGPNCRDVWGLRAQVRQESCRPRHFHIHRFWLTEVDPRLEARERRP